MIDGHNRYEICTRLDKPFDTIDVRTSLADRDDVKAWIIRNQFSRRNLTITARGELALILKPLIAAKAKENQKQSEGRGKKGCQISGNLKPIDTKREVAKLAGILH